MALATVLAALLSFTPPTLRAGTASGVAVDGVLDEASWATARFRPFMRMALTVAARRGMARQLSRWWRASDAVSVLADGDADDDDDLVLEDVGEGVLA